MQKNNDKYSVPAKWTPDCQGKQDYDGILMHISTRYWPANYKINGMMSAKATIHLQYGEPDDSGYTHHSLVVAEHEFEAHTEELVKQQVEVWAFKQINDIYAKILKQESSKNDMPAALFVSYVIIAFIIIILLVWIATTIK